MVELRNNRVWEIDFLRGVALLLMVFFHLIWDLSNFYNYPFDYTQGVLKLTGKTAGFMFITITAVSCSFSRNNIMRGLKILGLAMSLTFVTYVFNPDLFIVFGILHLLGCSILLYPFLNKFNKKVLILLGVVCIILGQLLPEINTTTNILAPLGLRDVYFRSLDYYPLFPYLGIFIFGVVFAKIFYPQKQSVFNKQLPANPINFIGRHTLKVYIFHQPFILLVLYLLSEINLI